MHSTVFEMIKQVCIVFSLGVQNEYLWKKSTEKVWTIFQWDQWSLNLHDAKTWLQSGNFGQFPAVSSLCVPPVYVAVQVSDCLAGATETPS